jgi:hypothetical protein
MRRGLRQGPVAPAELIIAVACGAFVLVPGATAWAKGLGGAPGAGAPPARAAQPRASEQTPDAASGLSRNVAFGLAGGLGIAGVAAVSVGIAFGLHAGARADESRAGCTPANVCTPAGKELRDEALSSANVSTIAFVAGTALLGTGLYFLLSAPPAEKTTATPSGVRGPRFAPRVSSQAALLFLHGEF